MQQHFQNSNLNITLPSSNCKSQNTQLPLGSKLNIFHATDHTCLFSLLLPTDSSSCITLEPYGIPSIALGFHRLLNLYMECAQNFHFLSAWLVVYVKKINGFQSIGRKIGSIFQSSHLLTVRHWPNCLVSPSLSFVICKQY